MSIATAIQNGIVHYLQVIVFTHIPEPRLWWETSRMLYHQYKKYGKLEKLVWKMRGEMRWVLSAKVKTRHFQKMFWNREV